VSAAHVHRLRHLLRACRVGGLAVLLAGLLLLPASPVRANDPTPTTKAVALASPGVVYVSVAAEMSVRVPNRDLQALLGMGTAIVRGIRTEDLVSGSGFVVNPKGTVVTASHVVNFSDDELEQLKTYAVNKLFFEELPSDPYTRQSTRNQDWNRLLRDCYDEVLCQITVKPAVSVITPAQGEEGRTRTLPATIATSSEFEETDITILHVNATNLPTAPLAKTTGDLQPGQPIIALGFPGSADELLKTGRTEPTPVFGSISSVRSPKEGSGQVVQVDAVIESGTSGGEAVDAEGKVIGLISFTGVDVISLNGDGSEAGFRTQGYLRTVDDIHDALKKVGVTAERGEVDIAFAQAMNNYWTHHYSAAVSLYQRVLNLADGHLLAKRYLTLAQAKAGGSEDLPVPGLAAAGAGQDSDGTTKLLAFALLAVLIVALVVLLVLPIVVWRRPRLARRWMPDLAGRGTTAAGPTGSEVASAPLDQGRPFGDGQTVAARVPGGAGTQTQVEDRHPG
jgi:S1-C subfamily serine protease